MIDAAVLIPVYRSQDGELHIVMILRNPGGVHGGQIAFPGGKHDPEDETMLDTALREVREELGLIVARNDVLAELPMEQTRTTGYRVFPFLARIAVPDRWQIAEREIAEIVDVKLTRPYPARCPRQNDRAFPDLGESPAGFVLPNWRTSPLGLVLSDLAAGAGAASGGRVGRLSS